MVCHECGKSVEEIDRFCTGCGTRLLDESGNRVGGVDAANGPEAGTGDTTELIATTSDDATTADDPGSDDTAPTADDTPVVEATPEPTPEPTHGDERTELIAVVDEDGDDQWGGIDPVWAATVGTPVVASPAVSTTELPATEPITEVWMESVPTADELPSTPYDFAEQEPVDTTQVMPTATAQMPAVVIAATPPPARGFRLGAVTLIGVATGLVTLAALFATVLSVTSDARLTPGPDTPAAFRTGDWIVDDLANNLSIAGLIAVISMVAGGVAAGFRWRWGAGLAGGAGLAMAGLAAVAVGLAQVPIDAAHDFARIPSEQQFTLTITRDLGYWLLVAAGALGVVLFFASINDAIGDRRSGLNPWIAALGALATVVAAAGPLLPESLADFSDNWYLDEGTGALPALLLVGRLVQLGLLVFTGVVGFLSVRRWGLGVAIGGSLPIIWLAVSTLFELTDAPIGPGFRNPGATDMHLHGVTIIGASAVGALAILAVIAAYDQGVRERP